MKRTLTAVVLVIIVLVLLGTIANASFQLEYAEGVPRDDGMAVPTRREVVYPLPPRPLAAPVAVQTAPRLQTPTRLPVAAPAGSVKARVLAAWPGDDVWVAKTVACESGFDLQNVGGGGNNYFGLFQMGPWARGIYGNPLNQSVEQQVASAWRLLNDEGSGQWSCSPYSYHP